VVVGECRRGNDEIHVGNQVALISEDPADHAETMRNGVGHIENDEPGEKPARILHMTLGIGLAVVPFIDSAKVTVLTAGPANLSCRNNFTADGTPRSPSIT
jgi:hypothetical protein